MHNPTNNSHKIKHNNLNNNNNSNIDYTPLYNNDGGLIENNIECSNISNDNTIGYNPSCNNDDGTVEGDNDDDDDIGRLALHSGVFTSTSLTIFLHLTEIPNMMGIDVCDGKHQTKNNHSYLHKEKGGVSEDKNQNYDEEIQSSSLRDSTIISVKAVTTV